jgi:hypothetical protein
MPLAGFLRFLAMTFASCHNKRSRLSRAPSNALVFIDRDYLVNYNVVFLSTYLLDT